MSFYDSNLKVLEGTRNYLFSRIQEKHTDPYPNSLDGIEMVQTLDGDFALIITRESEQLCLNSLYSPSHEAERWAKQFDMKNIGIVVTMFGLGNGACVREMIRKLNGQGVLFIYEPSPELFFYVLEHYDITDILNASNVSITVEGINDTEIKNLLSNYVDWINLKSQIFCSHPQYKKFFPDSAKVFYKIVQDNINRTVVNKNTDVAISRLLITNTIKNIKFLGGSNLVTDLIGEFPSNVPAIIVAAGPSLDKNIDELKRAKGKMIIFAVDTAMKYLLSHDILPDFIVTLDPKKSMKHLTDPRCSDIPMFCRFDSRPEHLEANHRNLIFYNLEGYISTIYRKLGKETGNLHSGGSVATGAFSICETLGFRRIILVGQDLAYEGDKTHAGGVSVDFSNAGSSIEMVEDIYGNLIKTRYDWYVYIKWFEDAAALFGGDEVIDATEGGAKIAGTRIMTLKAAIDQYSTEQVGCSSIVERLEPALKKDEIPILLDMIRQDISDLDKISLLAQESLGLCDRLINKYQKSLLETSASVRNNQALSSNNIAMEAMAVYELIDWDIAADTSDQMSNLYQRSEDMRTDKLATYEQARAIYKAITESVARIKPMFIDGFSRLEESLRAREQNGR